MITKEENPYGGKWILKLPFGLSFCWGHSEYEHYVWLGTQNGGLSIVKDHP